MLTPNDGGTTTDASPRAFCGRYNGATVINMSLGADADDPVLAAAVAEANRLGVVEVAAAGNQGDGTDNPRRSPTPRRIRTSSEWVVDYWRDSSRLPSWGDWVDVVAPAPGWCPR